MQLIRVRNVREFRHRELDVGKDEIVNFDLISVKDKVDYPLFSTKSGSFSDIVENKG